MAKLAIIDEEKRGSSKRKEERKMKKGCGCIEEIPPSLILPFVSDGT
jgi:hypothetical protein